MCRVRDEEVNSLMCISFVICMMVLIIFNLNSHSIVDDEVENVGTCRSRREGKTIGAITHGSI